MLNGKVDVPPQNLVSVSTPLGGYLKSTNLLPGKPVKKGEVLAIIEDPQFIQLQQDYLITNAKLVWAQAEYNRQSELNKSQASSDKLLQQALFELNSTKIMLKSIAEKLKIIAIDPTKLNPDKITKSIPVYSPINGFVSKVNVNIGKYLSPTDVLCELVDPSDIHLNLKVLEKHLASLTIGQKLISYTNNQVEKKYEAEILLIGKDINSEGFAEVHCHFEGGHRDLLPGMYMNADLKIKNISSYVVEETAVVKFEEKNYLFIKNASNHYEMKEVKLGISNEQFTQLINFQDFIGKTIVIKGSYGLLMALKNKEEE